MIKKNKIILVVVFTTILFSILFFFYKDKNTNVLKKYDPETKETITIEYILKHGDTIFQGKFINYNEKGNKTYEGIFINGHLSGKTIYYFDNGIIKSIYYYKNSKIIEENIDNFPSGKIMRYTSYFDSNLSTFIIRFDKRGNVESYKGYPIIEIYQYKKTNQYLKVGDTLKHKYIVANIPNAKRSLRIENIGIDNTKAKRTFKKTSQVGLEVKEILTKKGINKIQAIVKYEFNDTKMTVINDTISFEIEVH